MTATATTTTTRLAHISDLHILDLTGVGIGRFLNKRITGLANLFGARNDAHPIAIAEALVRQLRQALDTGQINHILLTGDVTNLALESEFERARQILEPIASYDRLSVVPGNHDIYTAGSARSARFEAYFGDLMWADDAPKTYPWVKDLPDLRLVGFCSAKPRLPIFAHGSIAQDQLQRGVDAIAQEPAPFTVAMLHHNLHRRSARKTWMHGLRDRDAVLRGLKSAGTGLVIHGHTHAAHRFTHDGTLPVIGCGSSTWQSDNPDHRARFNVYTVENGRFTQGEVHHFDPVSDTFKPNPEAEFFSGAPA